MNEVSGFFNYYRFLSNFYPIEIEYEGLKYKNSEAAFQAAKVLGKKRKEFTKLSPRDAKRKGRRVFLRPDWKKIKDNVMYEIVKIKFSQRELKEKLLLTGNMELIEENTWGDRYWGVCEGKGLNKLGKILMKVRKELS